MVCHQASCAFVPGMGTFHDPAFGQHDKVFGWRIREQELLHVVPNARVAIVGVTDDFHVQGRVRCLDTLFTFAGIGAIGVELL